MSKIDHQEDSAAIRRYLESRMQEFSASGKAISAIEVGYEVSQAGWLYVHADGREQHERDGEWTLDLDDDEVLDMEHWIEADAEEIGEFVKQVVMAAGEAGLFSSLANSGPVQIDIEDFDGGWAWPAYDDLGKTNLA